MKWVGFSFLMLAAAAVHSASDEDIQKALSAEQATKICRQEIEKQTVHVKPEYHAQGYTAKGFGNGRVGVTQGFTAQNAFGVDQDYRVYCLVKPDGSVEVQSLDEK